MIGKLLINSKSYCCVYARMCLTSLSGRDLHVREVLYNSTHLDSCLTKCYFQRVSSVVILTLASLHLCIKAFTFIKVKFSYLLDFVNWLEASPFLGAVVFSWTFNSRCLCMPVWQWEVGVVTVFLSWITLMTYIRRLPITGIYVLMFLDIFYILCKMVVLMLLVVVAFGLSFYMVFYEPDHLGVGIDILCMYVQAWIQGGEGGGSYGAADPPPLPFVFPIPR